MFAPFTRRTLPIFVAALALVVTMASPGAAQPGTLDPSFDLDGRVTTDFGDRDSAGGVAIQTDGKIVAAGFGPGAGGFNFAVARYNSNGSLDPTFDTDGMVSTDFTSSDNRAWAVAIQTDGKIVVAGQSFVATTTGGDLDFALARYNTDGSLDTGFSGDGKMTMDLGVGETDAALAVAIETDGQIVAAGYVRNLFPDPLGPADFAVARFNTDGTPDMAFGAAGKMTTDFAMDHDEAWAVAIQTDGKIVLAGPAFSGTFDFGLARYNPDGTPDIAFDTDGKVNTDLGGSDSADGLVIQSDGKIVVGGSAQILGAVDFALARYNPNGSLDAGFDGDGKVATDMGGDDHITALALQADGKIVAVGYILIGTYDFALARYRTDGSLDPIWGGGDGMVTTDFGGASDIAHAVAIQSDKKIVAAGCAFCLEAYDFALARYRFCRTTTRPVTIPC